jgi:hypothetical protein
MKIISRSQWGARAPKGRIYTASWPQRDGVAIHHSAGNTDDTVREIQDGDMDSDGFSDIGYNFVVDNSGRIYEGRKGTWTAVGAHAGGQNTEWLGVCWIGNAEKTQPSAAAKRAIRWIYDEACHRAGRKLAYRGHGQVPGQSTACPGKHLKNWIADGMPTSGTTPPKPTTPTKPTTPPATGTDWTEEIIMSLPTLKQGDRGPAVGRLQALLAAAGYPPRNSFNTKGEPDDDFGDGTGDALAAFQVAKNVKNSVRNGKGDRQCGRHSWTRLIKG